MISLCKCLLHTCRTRHSWQIVEKNNYGSVVAPLMIVPVLINASQYFVSLTAVLFINAQQCDKQNDRKFR